MDKTEHLRISGSVERIVYFNEENNFSVVRLRRNDKERLATIVGNIPPLKVGENLTAEGIWVRDKKFGEQFKVSSCQITPPATIPGIKKYLASTLIKGIGSVMAQKITDKFGIATLDVIENNPDALSKIRGIGKKRIEWIIESWRKERKLRDVIIFLGQEGIGASYSSKIYKRYGDETVRLIRQNPYRLIDDIEGVGFLTADKIARGCGIRHDSSARIEAALLHAMKQLAGEGNVYYSHSGLVSKASGILKIDKVGLPGIIDELSYENKLIVDREERVYLPFLHSSEIGCSEKLGRLRGKGQFSKHAAPESVTGWIEENLSVSLSPLQKRCLFTALHEKVMVITGGPGTGKTTVINAILQAFKHILKMRVALCAPTGRAAKRMTEVCGERAKTIHRLLEYSFKMGGFQKDEKNPLSADVIIVDEASMIDIVLMNHLLKAIPTGTKLVIVGDINQLPSVGPGSVLADIINSGTFPIIRMREIFRQARRSMIIVNAHRINDGQFPYLNPDRKELSDKINNEKAADFHFIEEADPKKASERIVQLCTQELPRRFGFHPSDDIQVLSPMHRGEAGVENLNTQLRGVINPGGKEISSGNRIFRVMDKVMQIRNNYEKDVYNGDIGKIVSIETEEEKLFVDYPDFVKRYRFDELDQLVHAYAISVHKSQGSEYPAVVFPIMSQHYILLQRNLLYTGVTRAKKLVVLVGTKKAVWIAIKNNKSQKRFSYLAERLKGLRQLS